MSAQDDEPAFACADNVASSSGPLHARDDLSRPRNDACDSESRHCQFKLPGSGATTVFVSALMNSLPRWLLKANGKLRSFLLSILDVPRSLKKVSSSTTCSSVWPMPIPYPEVFSSAGSLRVERADLKRLVSVQVVCLSWLALGCPDAAPSSLAIGSRLRARQWTAVKYLEHLCVDGNTPFSVDAAFMGRAAAKVESMEAVLAALSRAGAFLKEDGNQYFSSQLSRPPSDSAHHFAKRVGRKMGKLAKNVEMTAKPLIAERLVFPGPPQFDPGPFLDPGTRALYERPLDCCDDFTSFQGEVPRVRVFATRENKVLLYKKLAETKRLKPVKVESKRADFVSGLFAVHKNLELDRMVLDGRPPNLLNPKQSLWCRSMASPAALGSLCIQDDHVLLASGEDLRDFFYQFRAGEQRTIRNVLSDPVTLHEAREIFGSDFEWDEEPVWVALCSLAMGDTLACEYAQGSHVAICLKHGVCQPHELLTIKDPLPRGLLQVGVIIDDLVILEQCLRANLEAIYAGERETAADGRAHKAQQGYEAAGLEVNTKKRFSNQALARFWDVDLDGDKGLVRGSSTRLRATIFITLRVVALGLSTVGLLECLAGSWIALLSARRRMFCLLEVIFGALCFDDAATIIRLSPELCDELLLLATLAPLAATDLRAPFSKSLVATDASLQAMAAVRATITADVSQELCRTSLVKGRWTSLLTPIQEWKRIHDLLDVADEVDEPYAVHPFWELCARGLEYTETWREKVAKKFHINVLEAKAYIKEEKRCAVQQPRRRVPFALDSQVCLGALVKGRSASTCLNSVLEAISAISFGWWCFWALLVLPFQLQPG